MTSNLNESRIVTPLEIIGYDRPGTESPIYSKVFTVKDVISKFTDIRGCQKILGLAYSQYARKLLIAGRLEGIKLPLRGYNKWFITLESVQYYRTHTLRSLKLTRYDLRIFPDDESKIVKALDALDIPYSLEKAYKKKEV